MSSRKPSEAVILAGGLGTRLRRLISDIPKPMADINGRPFLEFLMNYLVSTGIKRFVLSVGYKYECVIKHFGDHYKSASIRYSIENHPLGTGGGLKQALNIISEDTVLVLNGDSFFAFDYCNLARLHFQTASDITLSLKAIKNCDRYGTVKLKNQVVVGYGEKNHNHIGLINTGVYLINTNIFSALELPDVFSLEKDILESKFNTIKISGLVSDGYFIDIGIPEDFIRAQKELPLQKQMQLNDKS